VDTDAVVAAMQQVLHKHKSVLREVGSHQTKILELATFVGVVKHYEALGYIARYVHPGRRRIFKAKVTSRGHPWNFSRAVMSNGVDQVEIHMNLSVNGAHDTGTYVVDVGVVHPDTIPLRQPRLPWKRLDNADLITFMESKKLVVYPMLLAQFIGIVHELLPRHLGYTSCGHDPCEALPPGLISLGYFSGNSKGIVSAYPGRGISISVAENYDLRIRAMVDGRVTTPFGWSFL
jgi:hypothetical protein